MNGKSEALEVVQFQVAVLNRKHHKITPTKEVLVL